MEQPNLAYIKKLSGGDSEFENKILSILKEEFPIEYEVYENGISSMDYKATAEIVHKLKHKISILGLEKGYKIATEYENNLNNSNIELALEFDNVMKSITTYLKGV